MLTARLTHAWTRGPKAVFWLGAFFYVISFLAGGFSIFYMTAWAIQGSFSSVRAFTDWRPMLLGAGLLIGWLDNASIFWFARLPTPLVWTSIVAPWIALAAYCTLADSAVLRWLPFYLWATGLGLIHYSRLMQTPKGWLPWFRPRVVHP